MADQLKLTIASTFVQENPPQSFQLLPPIPFSYTPSSYNHGSQHINPDTIDYQLADNVNLIVLTCVSNFEIKLGTTANTPLTTKVFAYNGNSTDVFISNPGTNPISINFVTATF